MLDEMVLASQRVQTFAGAYPIEADGHVDRALSNLAVAAFDRGSEGLVANDLLPLVPVEYQSDKYFIIEKDAFRRAPDSALRAPGTAARTVQFKVSSDSFYCRNFALASETPLEFIRNADAAIRFRENASDLVVRQLLLDQEVRIAGLVTSITNIGSGVALTGTAKWSDFANSNPLADINTAHAFIRNQTGLLPNTAVIDWDTLMVLRRHPQLLDFHKFTSGGELTDERIRDFLKVGRLLIARGTIQNEIEGVSDGGAGTASTTSIWGNTVLFCRTDTVPNLQAQTFGMRFRWQPDIFPANLAVAVDQQNRPGQRHVEVVEAGYYQDERVVARDLAYAITTVL